MGLSSRWHVVFEREKRKVKEQEGAEREEEEKRGTRVGCGRKKKREKRPDTPSVKQRRDFYQERAGNDSYEIVALTATKLRLCQPKQQFNVHLLELDM